jgi:hypothetical protein
MKTQQTSLFKSNYLTAPHPVNSQLETSTSTAIFDGVAYCLQRYVMAHANYCIYTISSTEKNFLAIS